MKLIFAKRPGRFKESKAVVVMITLALAASAQLGCSSQSASQSKKDSIVMENKELVSLFFQRFSNGEIDQAFSLVSDDVSWWVPGPGRLQCASKMFRRMREPPRSSPI